MADRHELFEKIENTCDDDVEEYRGTNMSHSAKWQLCVLAVFRRCITLP